MLFFDQTIICLRVIIHIFYRLMIYQDVESRDVPFMPLPTQFIFIEYKV